MKAVALFAALSLVAVSAADSAYDCPQHCACTHSSFGGILAKCSRLDLGTGFSSDVVSLVLADYQEERLPAGIFQGARGLLTLGIPHAKLRHVSKDAFFGLNSLEDLDLSFNQLEHLDPATFQNSGLKRLNLNGNPLAFSKDKNFLLSDELTELTLAQANISDPDNLKELTGLPDLEFIDLSGNKLREIKNDTFSSLIYLEEIDLSDNLISRIDRNAFADIESLTSLNLRGNPLKTLEGIEIPDLRDLDVSHCNFELLSASTLEGFPELTSLKLSHNSLLNIDMDTFNKVPHLKDLDLSFNRLRGPISVSLFEFNKHLETLSFKGNSELRYLSGFKGYFEHLYRYDISDCGLTNLTSDMLRGMSSLATLNVSENSLLHIDPKTFTGLPNLVVLDLSSNILHALNSKLFINNKELSKLYLSKNNFRHLTPQLFQNTPNLYHLDVSNCRLTSLWNISESFMMRIHNILGKLTYLNVSGNRLTKLHPHYFISLENLQKLDISNNPIECTSDFSHVMQWLIMKKVMPNKVTKEDADNLDLIESNVQWDEVLRSVCPTESGIYSPEERIPAIPVIDIGDRDNSKAVEIPIIEETPLVWPMVLVWASIFSLIFALVNIIGLLIYRSRRNYSVLSYKANLNSSLNGHFPVRRGGRPIYQKLYEECSVPAPVHTPSNKAQLIAFLDSAFSKSNSNV